MLGQGLVSGDADIETPVAKRQFHRKVRSGCATCKARRVKCDEGKPTCLRCRASGKECLGYGTIPKPRVFEPSKTITVTTRRRPVDTDTESDDTSPSDSTASSSQTSLMFRGLRKRQSSSPDFNAPTATLPIFASPVGVFGSAQEKYSHDFFRHWLARFTAPRVEVVPDLWSVHFPKVGQDIPALRYVMTANGLVGTALLSKCSASDYEVARLSALEYVNSAIAYLVKHPQPPSVLMMIAWLLWQLDMAQGYFQSSHMHVESALKMASSLTYSNVEEQAVLGLLKDSFINDRYCKLLRDKFPFVLGAKTPARKRMAASLPLFRKTVQQIIVAQLKLAFDNEDSPLSSAEKGILLGSLRLLRKELEWLIDRWGSRVAPEDEIDIVSNGSFLSPWIEEVATGLYSLETLCVEFARALPVFILRMSHDDLQMRQDLVDFLQLMSMHYPPPESPR